MRIALILGSTRQNRFCPAVADWAQGHLARRPEIEVERLDLADFAMPFYAEPRPPAMKREPFASEAVERWTARVAESDGFVFVTPEYNHGPSAVLKNALDYVYREWNRKPAAFVAYGQMGGARSVEQLRTITVALGMVPLRTAVHLPGEVVMAAMKGEPVAGRLAAHDRDAEAMVGELVWWAGALKDPRERAAS